jgi:hypothetical protein
VAFILINLRGVKRCGIYFNQLARSKVSLTLWESGTVLIMTAIVICALLATCICLLVRAMRHLKQAEEKLKSASERADKWEAQCFNLGRRLREAEDDCGHLAMALAEEQGHDLSGMKA